MSRAWRDAHKQLGDALSTHLAGATIIASRQRPWASATFSGARHFYTLGFAAPRDHLLAGLGDHEFVLNGHIVADICVVEQNESRAEIEALTVEEA